MKTSSISLLVLCGLMAPLRPAALAAQTNDAPSPTAATDTIMGVKKSALAPPWSGGLDEVVKLSQSGVDESVVLTFVQNSPVAYRLSADEILRLRDAGVSSPVITALLQRGGQLRQQAAPAPVAYPTAPEVPPAAQQSTASYAAPADTAATSTAGYADANSGYSYPIVYSYPNYNYYSSGYGGYCYYPYYYYYPRYPYSRYYYPRYSNYPRPVPHNGFHAPTAVGPRSAWSVASPARPGNMMMNNSRSGGTMGSGAHFGGTMGNNTRPPGAVFSGAPSGGVRSANTAMGGSFRSR